MEAVAGIVIQICITFPIGRVERPELLSSTTLLPFAFPARLGEIIPGIPTAWACPELKDTSLTTLIPDDLVPVWPDIEGSVKGRAIEPLHPGVPKAAQADPQLYALLALVDVLRVGRAREREFAEAELEKRIADVHT